MHLQDRRSTFRLTDPDGNSSTVEIEARYVPVPVKLLARESINSKQSVKSAVMSFKYICYRSRHAPSNSSGWKGPSCC
jgi:hypothetical protein